MPPTTIEPWFHNISIWSTVIAWTIAQAIKFTCCLVKQRRLDFTYFVSTGGMPSAHSAAACAMMASIGLREGFASSLFALSFLFAAIVMFDAQSVRQAAGHQARLLNQIIDELFHQHHLSQQKLAELLGHTRIEVFVGLIIGVATAILVHRF